ncbi:hypothetical protein [Stutzerimonas frequens]|uniref:hypothetical protein n=1 Tax=Stutzerimonas frequens TaxID=2968969 RepID=UPI001AAFC622|nr:hypothetical protein J4H94_20290 [Stutzerimonas frequens]
MLTIVEGLERTVHWGEALLAHPFSRRQISSQGLDLANVIAVRRKQQRQCSTTGIADQLELLIAISRLYARQRLIETAHHFS